MCIFHDQEKYGANPVFCLACGGRWVPYISTPFDAEKVSRRSIARKKKRRLPPSSGI